ncbi:hypothetical protein B0T10DRAFT_556075 [Thelonectria olida]|uniref:Uncharacterized protein n=1 Tax=Thelonectria olida TaxID=1576542 RepID=A0A9P8WH21_9HYPO|nr:hypothetical protein B0T10DRAFT_556075 [Thelonectria olida]
MSQSHYRPPPWSMEFPPRLGEWEYEPPNTSEDRKRKSQKFSLSRFLNQLISRLENFLANEPVPQSSTPTTDATWNITNPKIHAETFGISTDGVESGIEKTDMELSGADQIDPDMADDSMADDSMADYLMADDSMADDSMADYSMADDSMTDYLIAEFSIAEFSMANDSIADDSMVNYLMTDDSMVDYLLAVDSMGDYSSADHSVVNTSMVDDSMVDDSITLSILELNQELEGLDLRTPEKHLHMVFRVFRAKVQPIFENNKIRVSTLKALLHPVNSEIRAKLNKRVMGHIEAMTALWCVRNAKPNDSQLIFNALACHLGTMDKRNSWSWHFFWMVSQKIRWRDDRVMIMPDHMVLETVISYCEHQVSSPTDHEDMMFNLLHVSLGVQNLTAYSESAGFWETVLAVLSQRYMGTTLRTFQRLMAVMSSWDKRISLDKCLEMYPGQCSRQDAWIIAKGRMLACGYLPVERTLRLCKVKWFAQAWFRLLMVAHAPMEEDRVRLVTEVYHVAKQTGYSEELIEDVIQNPNTPTWLFRDLAIASGDYRIADDLWFEAVSRVGYFRLTERWDWSTWIPFVEHMINDPDVPISKIFNKLALACGQPNETKPHRVQLGIKSRTQLLEMMGRWFLEQNCRTPRATVRAIQKCINVYRSIDSKLSPEMLRCLVEVVLRDLEAGGRGRLTRLAWLVRLVRHYAGDEEAERTLTQIRGWRWTIDHHAAVPMRRTRNQRLIDAQNDVDEAWAFLVESTRTAAPERLTREQRTSDAQNDIDETRAFLAGLARTGQLGSGSHDGDDPIHETLANSRANTKHASAGYDVW